MDILILEDSADDKLLLIEYLNGTPLEFSYSYAPDKQTYLDLLNSKTFDIILSDYNIPGYDVEGAFTEAKKIDQHLPFIIVSGEIQHDHAVQLVTEFGISDFILKDNLSRLYDSIIREMESSKTTKELEQTREILNKKNEELKKLSLVAKHTHNSVIIMNADGGIEWVNESFSRQTGYKSEEAVGKEYVQLLQGAKTNQNDLDDLITCIQDHLSLTTEMLYYKKNGFPFWVRINLDPVYNEKDILTNFIAVQEDITEFKSTQKALEESEDALKDQILRLKRSQDVAKLADWSLDVESGKITWSEGAFALFETENSKAPPSYEEAMSYYSPEAAEELNEVVTKAIEQAIPYNLELTINTKSGPKNFIHLGIPEKDGNGKVTALHGIVQDITAIKNMQAEILSQKQTIEIVADNIDGVLLQYVLQKDEIDSLKFISKGVEKVYGISQEDALRNVSLLWDVVLDEDIEAMRNSILASAKSMSDWDHTWRIRSKKGDIRYIKGVGRPVSEEDGSITWNSLLLDVTDVVELRRNIFDNEQRLMAAVKGAELGIWDINLITGENYTNERWWSMLGYEKHEMEFTFESFINLLHPDDREKPAEEINRIQEGGKNDIDIIVRIKHKDGEYRTFLDRAHAVSFDDNGNIERLIGTHLDITELIRLEEELNVNEFRLETAIEGADLGVWDTNLKEETTIANNRWYKMLGYEPHEVDDLYGLFFKSLHPEDVDKILNELEAIKKGKKESFEIILRVKNRFGDYITILDKGKALEFDADHNVVRMIGTVLDITEQVQLEQELKEIQFRLETAIDGANLGVWDANIRDKTNITNDRWFEMIGYSPEEIDEDSYTFFFSRVHPDDVDHITNEINIIEKGTKDSFEVTLRVKHKNGKYITILDKGTALEYDSEGHVVRMIGTHLDITEEISAQNRLKKSLSEKEMLIMEIHHRVKNNLAILAGLLELEIFSNGENPSLLKAINRIKSIGFVHELLYQSESLIEVNFKTYFESYLKHIKTTFGFGEEITISTDIAEGDLNVNEAVPLGLLVNELITNSIKYGVPEGGTISVSLEYSETNTKEHIFLYSDSGPGIDPNTVKEGTLGLELIKAMLSNLDADYELNTDGEFKLKAYFEPKERGAYGNPVDV